MEKTHAEQFCYDILKLDTKYAKPLVNVVMALASEIEAKHPTALSNSPFFQYHYSILNKLMGEIYKDLKEEGQRDLRSLLRQLCMRNIPEMPEYKLSSDFTTNRKAESPTLRDRVYIHVPNIKIPGNRPLDIGYYYSYVNLGLYGACHPFAWSLPLDNQRLEVEDDGLVVASSQLIRIMEDETLPFGSASKVTNSADSGYCRPAYVDPLDKYRNLVLVLRLRAGMKVYGQYEGEQKAGGRDKVYADAPYYLQTEHSRLCFNPKTKSYFEKEQRSIFDLDTDEQDCFETQTSRGRKLIIELYRWNNLLIRGTRQHYMGDKPFDLVAARCIDKETGQLVFKRDLYIGLWGEKRRSHTLWEAYNDYRHRYDIEPHNRFSKQALLADKYQTSKVEHLDAWLWVVQLTWWLLYACSTLVDVCVNSWEKYLPEVKRAKQEQAPKSAALTRKGTKKLFSTFDLKPFEPQKSKNGAGRKKGERQKRRIRYKVRRKNKSKAKIKLAVEKIE